MKRNLTILYADMLYADSQSEPDFHNAENVSDNVSNKIY
jgi:hypothetical protein